MATKVAPRILVAGIGNIFLGDDGFGSEVVRGMSDRFTDTEAVRVIDYGIKGMHLAYDLLDGWDALVLVDAVPNQGSPGTVRVFEADHDLLNSTAPLDGHAMDPGAVFACLRTLGGEPPRTIVVGCEVEDIGDGMGLSASVGNAVPDAVRAVTDAITMIRSTAGVREG